MPIPNSPEQLLTATKFRSDELPHSFFGDVKTLELPRGTIVEFDAHGPVRDNDSEGLALVEKPIATHYPGGYVRAYEEVLLPPDTGLIRLSPVTALGLSELRKRRQDQNYGLLTGEYRQAARAALGDLSILQLLEGEEPDPEVITSVALTIRVSESTIDLLNAVERYMDQRTNEP